jgi:hypothetical protein
MFTSVVVVDHCHFNLIICVILANVNTGNNTNFITMTGKEGRGKKSSTKKNRMRTIKLQDYIDTSIHLT